MTYFANSMARGGGNGAGEKMKNEALRKKMEKGRGKRRKGKGGEWFFFC